MGNGDATRRDDVRSGEASRPTVGGGGQIHSGSQVPVGRTCSEAIRSQFDERPRAIPIRGENEATIVKEPLMNSPGQAVDGLG